MFFSSFFKDNLAYRVFIKEYKKYFIFGTIALIVVDVINIIPPLLIKEAVDTLTTDGSLTRVAYISGLYIIINIVQ